MAYLALTIVLILISVVGVLLNGYILVVVLLTRQVKTNLGEISCLCKKKSGHAVNYATRNELNLCRATRYWQISLQHLNWLICSQEAPEGLNLVGQFSG